MMITVPSPLGEIRAGILSIALLLGAACASATPNNAARTLTGPDAASELLAADRAFAAAAKQLDLASALARQFDADVVMQAPGGHVRGAAAAEARLRADTADAGARIEWTPVRSGVSSDAQHGFTFGYLTITAANGSQRPGKYVAYWRKTDAGWRVLAYNRVRRTAAPVSLDPWAPSLPTPGLSPGVAATVQRYAAELRATELAFSAESQVIGLGPAFVKYGAPDAVNAGGANAPDFVRGPEAIGKHVHFVPPPAISWWPTDVFVASTGDLGLSVGTIRIGATADPAARTVPFFTIWKRRVPGDPWRYVAE